MTKIPSNDKINMSKKAKVYDSAKGYDLAAKRYDDKQTYLNSFEQNRLMPLLGDVKAKKVLDVGAGTGRLAVQLANLGALVTATDVSEKMLDKLKRKNKKIAAIIGDAETLDFPDREFDIVVAAFLIVHLRSPKRFFDEAYRVLKDGGRLIVTNVNQKDPPVIETKEGDILIDSYYHRPEQVREDLETLAFSIKEDLLIKEKGVWINQIIVAQK